MNPELAMLAKMERDRNPLPKPSCETCLFWLETDGPDGNGVAIGDCRRYPPVFVPDPRYGDAEPLYPYMESGEWCGEYAISLTPPPDPVA